MSRTRSAWLWSALAAAIAGGVGIAINFATDLRTSVLAWSLVGGFAVAAAAAAAAAAGAGHLPRSAESKLRNAVVDRQLRKLNESTGDEAVVESIEIIAELRRLSQFSGMRRSFSRPTAMSVRAHDSVVNLNSPATSPVSQLGYSIFKWLLLLAGILIGIISLYAFPTYPSPSDVAALIGRGGGQIDAVEASRRLHADWLQQIKDLGQLFLLTPVFPLIAAVIGYIFGVRNGKHELIVSDADVAGETPKKED
ncbi:hypothetical protein [Amycolatopsis sp. NPDC051371]|uniref:hypothetical protein n=1 Tax=Amycolatopsis sp. NPDC051371 TaxID=3155800 RepID=UPI003429EBF9